MTERRLKKIIIAEAVVIAACLLVIGSMLMKERFAEPETDKENASRIPVITYHRLCSDEFKENVSEQRSLWTSESVFAEEMKWLHDNGYRTLSMDELYSWYEGDIRVPEKSVVITFDDGYYNVVEYGLPILEKYKMKATMFAIGAAVTDTQNRKSAEAAISIGTANGLRLEYPEFEFESHTYGMHRNSPEDAVVFKMSKEEIRRDFDRQEKRFPGYGFKYMAYPYGKYTDPLIEVLKERGYRMAFTYGSPGYVTRSSRPYELPRIGIRGDLSIQESFYRWFDDEHAE